MTGEGPRDAGVPQPFDAGEGGGGVGGGAGVFQKAPNCVASRSGQGVGRGLVTVLQNGGGGVCS